MQILHVQILQVGDCMGLMFQTGLSWGRVASARLGMAGLIGCMARGWCRVAGGKRQGVGLPAAMPCLKKPNLGRQEGRETGLAPFRF